MKRISLVFVLLLISVCAFAAPSLDVTSGASCAYYEPYGVKFLPAYDIRLEFSPVADAKGSFRVSLPINIEYVSPSMPYDSVRVSDRIRTGCGFKVDYCGFDKFDISISCNAGYTFFHNVMAGCFHYGADASILFRKAEKVRLGVTFGFAVERGGFDLKVGMKTSFGI